MISKTKHNASRSYDTSVVLRMNASNNSSKPVSPQKSVRPSTNISNFRVTFEKISTNSSLSSKPTPIKCLNTSIWSKEVYIIFDGIVCSEDFNKGFIYKFFTFGNVKRKNQQQELNDLFDSCCKNWVNRPRPISLFTIEGKILKSLTELPPNTKVAVVGNSLEYIGFSKFVSEREIISIIDNKIVIKDTETFVTCPRRKGVLCTDDDFSKTKSFLLKFRAKSETAKLIKPPKKLMKVDKFKFLSSVKEKLGETSAKIDRSLPKLEHHTLKYLVSKYELPISDVHKIYAKYKTLLMMSVAQNPSHNFKTGINNATLIQCLRKGEPKEDGLIEKLIDTIDSEKKGFLTWEQFLKTMSVIHFGSVSQQIDMMFRIFDSNLSGTLSYDEIKELCKIQLQSSKEDKIAGYLAESFAKVLFTLACVPLSGSLSPEELKKVLQDKDQQSIIKMFCNFDI